MKYLFFDIECSNCFDGIGKMCEFGYVQTDDQFNVLSKDVIPMSPGKGGKNRFHLKGRKNEKDLELAWDYDFYYKQPEFPTFYNRIKNLMSDEDTICFGFACDNDISFIHSSCKRYGLTQFDFTCYDIQIIAANYTQTHKGHLKDTYLRLVGPAHVAEFQEHLSRDDALMTMKIFNAVCTLKNVSSIEAIRKSSNAITTLFEWADKKEKSTHISENAVCNTSGEEIEEFKKYIVSLRSIALKNKNNDTPQIVDEKSAYKALYIIDNTVLKKDGDVLLFLTSASLLNTYVKQKDANKRIGYWFKKSLENVLRNSKDTIYKTLKVNYIDHELNGNNILIFEFNNSYQFSYHCVERRLRKLILNEYKCDSAYWNIKNKTFINDLFANVLSNKLCFSNLTNKNSNLLNEAEKFSAELIENPDKQAKSNSVVNNQTRKGKIKTKGQIMWEEMFKKHESLISSELYKEKKVALSSLIKKDTELTNKLIEKMNKENFIAVDLLKDADILITLDDNDKERLNSIFKKDFSEKMINIDVFLSM